MSRTKILPPVPTGSAVFASVFSSGIKPPKHHQRFAPKTIFTISDIQQAQKAQLRLLLGIGDENFAYGQDRLIPNAGPPFHSHFASCAPADQIREPTATDHAIQITRESSSPLWPILSDWRSAVGP